MFLFAAQGRANARVHQLKVSSSALHRGCEASAILSPRLDARLCFRPFSSGSLRRAAPEPSRDLRRSFLWNVERREIRLSFFFLLKQGKKFIIEKVSSGKKDSSFSRILYVLSKVGKFLFSDYI